MVFKKIINDPYKVVDEMVEGIVLAHSNLLKFANENKRAVIRKDAPIQNKVGILIGGGSGHEPAFLGYVGKGLADAAAIGNVFASPSPEPIIEATKAINGGKGVLYMYGNYAGDIMNFDMAAEICQMEDIPIKTVLVTDDIASAPLDKKKERRGVAGDFYVFKIAGAAADKGMDLDEVSRLAEKANDMTISMGVALGPCSLPHTLEPSFVLENNEMEIGLGIHGEAGVRKGNLLTADEITTELMDKILNEMNGSKKVSVLINGLGSTPLMELYIMYRKTYEILSKNNIEIHSSFVGEYVTSLEMNGASITIMKLDDELQPLLENEAHCSMFRV
jgi:phosphoenolpyruvate---glycerone phosphotransferase subunit DhaK